LRSIATRGYAIERDEFHDRTSAVAVAITTDEHDGNQEAVRALSLSAVSDDDPIRHVTNLRAAAVEIATASSR
jgi:DNA-binding IclR family transcriptional regulator